VPITVNKYEQEAKLALG